MVAAKTLEERDSDLERLLPAQIRSLSRLNDQETASIKADIATLRAQTLAGFASIESRLDRIESRLDGVEGRLDGVEGRLDRVEGRLDRVEGKLSGVESRLGKVEADLAGIKQAIDALPRVLAEEVAKIR
jgi:chromosome segregation ATPase